MLARHFRVSLLGSRRPVVLCYSSSSLDLLLWLLLLWFEVVVVVVVVIIVLLLPNSARELKIGQLDCKPQLQLIMSLNQDDLTQRPSPPMANEVDCPSIVTMTWRVSVSATRTLSRVHVLQKKA